MNKIILTIIASFGLCVDASAAIVAQWDFNDNPSDGIATTGTLLPSIGTGIASSVDVNLTSSFNAPAGSSDPLGSDSNNSAWRLLNFAAQSTGNKTRGGQFNVDTTGYENITLTWDHANSATANKYYRILYSVDNGATWVEKDVIINSLSVTWNNPIATVSFVTVPGANNNTNFGVRILSEFQSTATGSGTAGYVAVGGGTYSTAGTFRMDMVTFDGGLASGNVSIITDPTNQVVGVGHPASFSVVAGGGTSAIGYQWRTNSTPIPDATNSVYSIAAAQFSDAASYDVVVTNAVNTVTSAVATLTVRTPLNLSWTGSSSALWDSTAVNWVNTNTLANVAYASGDNVSFGSEGSAAATVNLAELIQPSSVTVDAGFDYLLRSDFGGKIIGPTGLTKRGGGVLTMDTDNTYSGPTVIEAGTLQLGTVTPRGAMGTGPVTNHGNLVFNRSDSIVVANNITGSGNVTNLGKGVTFSGTNVYNGTLATYSSTMLLLGNHTVNSADVIIAASTATGLGGATRLGLSGGISVGAGTTLHITGSSASPDLRCTFYSPGGTNSWSGPIIIDGGGPNSIQADGTGTELHVNGPVTGPGFAGSGSLLLRGSGGSGILNGTITLPGNYVNKTDSGVWTINSTGNSWLGTVLALGTLKLGANNALPAGITLQMGQVGIGTATLDLGGFNQQIAILQDGGGIEIVGNSSVASDSTLTVGSGSFNGVIQDALLDGTRKTGLTVNGGTFSLAGANTYSGTTTIAAGILALIGSGEIPNSSEINIAGGALDVTARGDATLTVGAAQKLKGNGTFSILGNLVNNGTIELKVNKTGGVVSNDKVAVSSQITYGGTLKLVLTGEALTAANTIPVVSAGAYAVSSFAAIDPAVPGGGLTWDTSTLDTDGILRIAGTAAPTIASTVLSPSGTELIFSGTGGGAGGSYSVLTSTNVATPVANWTTNQTGVFDGSGNFTVTNAIIPGATEFFRLKIP